MNQSMNTPEVDDLIHTGVRVTLRRPHPEDPGTYEQVAVLDVYADGTLHLDDPERLLLFEVPAPSDGGFVTFEQDALRWARGAAFLYRTGYLVADVTEMPASGLAGTRAQA